MPRPLPAAVACLVLLWPAARPAAAQESIPGCRVSKQWTIDRITKDHYKLVGAVEVDCDAYSFYADEVEVFADEHRIVATGNVVYTEGTTRIAGDRSDFDTVERTGTFHNAAGSASLGGRVSRDMLGGQEPDLYFYGKEIAKIGPDRYRITSGAFTTCVQPTPRWELTSGSVVLRLDHYATLTNTLLKVKNVPVLYLPVMYYPIQRDDRATGFLMPTYGRSTIKGVTLSNQFFWAINRSQDATVMLDWFSKTGFGYGAEYRYVVGPGSEGTFRAYRLREHETTYTRTIGDEPTETVVPARKSYQLRGSVSQALPGRLRVRGNVDYFSDVTVQQTYNQDIYNASLRQRGYGLNVTGNWRAVSLSANVGRNETFTGETTAWVTGGMPRVSLSRSAQRIANLPLVFQVGGEFARLVYGTRQGNAPFVDNGLTRIDVMPQLRVPFTRLTFLPMDAYVAFRETWYSQSLNEGVRVPESVQRRYVKMGGSITGPILTRIFNTPTSGYAERFKHLIEPSVSFERITAIDNDASIVKLDGMDYIVGGTTRVTYGVTTRLLAKRREGAAGASAREILSAALTQTYYSDARASLYDYSYSTSFTSRPPSKLSPISLNVRGAPTARLTAQLRVEYDTDIEEIQSISASGTYAAGSWLQASAGWSTRRLASQTAYFRADNYVNAGVTLRTPGNRLGGSYTFNYDLGEKTLLQNRVIAYYNVQCCGFAFEYQTFNFPTAYARFVVDQDRRINFSVTLAGLGTFSNLFGALGGATQ